MAVHLTSTNTHPAQALQLELEVHNNMDNSKDIMEFPVSFDYIIFATSSNSPSRHRVQAKPVLADSEANGRNERM